MRKKILCKKPTINTRKGDLNLKWYVDYSCPDPAPPHYGKLRRKKDYKGLHKHKTFEARMEAAEIKRQELETKLRSGWNPWIDGDTDKYIYTDQLQTHHSKRYGVREVSQRNFTYYSSKWLEEDCIHLAKESRSTYQSRLRVFSNFITSRGYDSYDITAIDHEVIEEFFSWLIKHEKVSQFTVKKYFQILHKVFAMIEKDIQGLQNPVSNCPKSPHTNDCAPVAIPTVDMKILIEQIKHHPQLYLFVRFMHNCFLRPGMEIRLMKIGWIDFERGLITIPEAFCKSRKKSVTIPKDFLNILTKEHKLHRADKQLYVFGKNGEPGEIAWGKNYFRNQFVKIRTELDLPNFYKLYSFKHTGNVAAYDKGLTISSLQRQNGHSSITTTDHYMRRRGIRVDEEIKHNFPSL